MRQTICLVIIAIYTFGSGFSDPSRSFAPTIKVQLEHTHEVASWHHHHHDFENDGGHEDAQELEHDHNKNAEPKKSIPHSHEVSISMVGVYCMSSISLPSLIVQKVPQAIPILAYDESPPEDIALRSIFRPPIA